MVQVTYGQVAITRHSAKHCRGTVRKSPLAITAGSKRLGSNTKGSEFRLRECETLAGINAVDTREFFMKGRETMVIKGRDGVMRTEVINTGILTAVVPERKKVLSIPERKHESEVFHDKVKMFKALPERSVNCSARGGHNGGTKDKSVSCTVASSPDVDKVSSMTGVIPLSRDGKHLTKVSDGVYAKERRAFMDSMVQNQVNKGRACWTKQVRKEKRLRRSALRNSASA